MVRWAGTNVGVASAWVGQRIQWVCPKMKGRGLKGKGRGHTELWVEPDGVGPWVPNMEMGVA